MPWREPAGSECWSLGAAKKVRATCSTECPGTQMAPPHLPLAKRHSITLGSEPISPECPCSQTWALPMHFGTKEPEAPNTAACFRYRGKDCVVSRRIFLLATRREVAL